VPDLFPGNFVETVEDLRRRVEELEALLNARKPLTSASQGWRMANMSIPTVGPGEIQIGSSGGEFFVATENGVRTLPASNVAAAPTWPGSFTSENVGSAPNAAQYNALRADAVMLHTSLRSVIVSGRAYPVWEDDS
jgi:hypothetical protein